MVIKSKTVNEVIRYVANIIFFVSSGLLSVNMFIQFSDIPLLKWVLAILSIGLEFARYYQFVNAKAIWNSPAKYQTIGNYKINMTRLKAIPRFLVYLGLASVVIAASFGFSATALETQGKKAESYIDQKATIQTNIITIEDQIHKKVALQNGMSNYTWRYEELDDQIKSLRKDLKKNQDDLGNFQETKISVEKSMFEPIGKAFGKTGPEMKFILLILIAILLEISLMTTSISIQLDEPQKTHAIPSEEIIEWIKKNHSKMVIYIGGLMDIKAGLKRLNSNPIIQKKTGLSEEICEICKKALQRIKIKGKTLINTSQGSSDANFTKEEILQVMNDISGGRYN